MVIDAARTDGFTPKGARTRARIIAAAAALIHERGLAATTVEDVRAAAEVSGSQLYHYFAGKNDLVEAVIDRQADAVAATQEQADLSTVEGRRAWRDLVVAEADRSDGTGGCPLGSLGAQVAETDADARVHVAAGFARWTTAISNGLQTRHIGQSPVTAVDPDALAITLLAVLQGGLLLAQISRDTRALAIALDTVLALASTD